MKLLHTSDWHVGKEIRGHSRADEHRAVLEEIATVADERDVELVVVAGDLFETAAPSAEAESIVYRALLRLAEGDRRVAVISGNHDNARRLRAVAPLLRLGQVHVVTEPTHPDSGGVLRFTSRQGEDVQLALLPFVSQRGIVRAADLLAQAAYEGSQAYDERLRGVLAALCDGFSTDSVNLVAAHGFVEGGQTGGGERVAHLVEQYRISALAFPAAATYVALGHLHKPMRIPAGPPVHYCGSPLQLDFGERTDVKQVNVVEVSPGVPAKVDAVPLSSGRRLHTVRGSRDEVVAAARELGDDCWIRAFLTGPRATGVAEDIREAVGPHVVDVIIDAPESAGRPKRSSRRGRSPRELFAEFLGEREIDDDRLLRLFDELLDVDGTGGGVAGSDAPAPDEAVAP